MSYQTSHEVGGGPFRPNKERGVWSGPHDFALACLNNAFRIDNIYAIAIIPMVMSKDFFYIFLWIISTMVYAVPIFFIQSFLGQFSSSGYISALRISPLFKGLGYIGLAINVITLSFHGVLIAIPMLYLIHSLQPTLPWSCNASHPWNDNSTLLLPNMSSFRLYGSHCDLNETAIESEENVLLLTIPSVEFFRHKLGEFNFDIFACVLVAWAAVAYVSYQSSEKIGIIIRYCTMAAISLLIVVFFRMLFLPGIVGHLGFAKPYYPPDSWIVCLLLAAITAFMTFGPGWGTMMSLASYNKFKADIMKNSWQVPLSQLGIFILLGLVTDMAEVHLTKTERSLIPDSTEMQWMSFMTIPSTLASMDYPHLWTWMFLLMLILGCFNLTLTQLFSVHTAILDEFEQLRPFRKELIFGSAAVLALVSAFFCTIDGLNTNEIVVDMNLFSQCLLNVLIVIVVLWIYGRDRFQRDVKFMTNELMSNWKLNYIRFVAPIFIIIMACIASAIGLHYRMSFPEFRILCLCLAIVPWFALPAYCVYRLRQASGDWKLRLSRCLRPTDWFPVDLEDKQLYDETFENRDTTQDTLTIVL